MHTQIDQSVLTQAKADRLAFLKQIVARLFARKEQGQAHA